MAGFNQKKDADEEDKGAKGSGGGRSWRGRGGGGGGGGGGGADEGARGALTLTFVTTRTATQWFGLDVVWVDQNQGQVEVSTVNADRMHVVGWRCTTEKHKEKCLQPSDVLIKVNGVPVDDDNLEAASAFMDKARHRFPITLEVSRNTKKRYSTTRGDRIESEHWCAHEGARRVGAAHKITWLGDGDDDVGLGRVDSEEDSDGTGSDRDSEGRGAGDLAGDGGRRDGSRKRARGPSRPAPSRCKGGPHVATSCLGTCPSPSSAGTSTNTWGLLDTLSQGRYSIWSTHPARHFRTRCMCVVPMAPLGTCPRVLIRSL